jgi:hypothetical protein
MPFVPSVTQIAPRGIHGNNQLNFLNPKPAFDPLLAVNRVAHIVETFAVYKSINLVALTESRSIPTLVFPNAPLKVICNPNVKRLGAIGQNVNAVVPVVAGIHRSFASLRMTGLRLCIEEMQKSVRNAHQNCDDSLPPNRCHPERSEGPMHLPRRELKAHFTSTRSIYSATCTFQPNSFFIRSRSCEEAAGSPCTR